MKGRKQFSMFVGGHMMYFKLP